MFMFVYVFLYIGMCVCFTCRALVFGMFNFEPTRRISNKYRYSRVLAESVCPSVSPVHRNVWTILQFFLFWRSKRWFSWSWSVQLFLPLCFYKNLLNRTKAFFTFFLPRKEIVNKIKCTKKMVVASMAMKIQQINKRIWLGSWKNGIWMVSSNLCKYLPTYLRFRTLLSVCRIRIFYNTWKDWMIGNEG